MTVWLVGIDAEDREQMARFDAESAALDFARWESSITDAVTVVMRYEPTSGVFTAIAEFGTGHEPATP